MGWEHSIVIVREAHLRATLAECAADWHVAVKEYLVCLEAAEHAHDLRATRFFASRLVASYGAMGFTDKAARYRELEVLAAG